MSNTLEKESDGFARLSSSTSRSSDGYKASSREPAAIDASGRGPPTTSPERGGSAVSSCTSGAGRAWLPSDGGSGKSDNTFSVGNESWSAQSTGLWLGSGGGSWPSSSLEGVDVLLMLEREVLRDEDMVVI